MPKGYRKIQYYTETEAERSCDALNGANRRSGMVGSRYDTEKLKEGWVVNHFVGGQLARTLVKNGMLPYDYEEGYLEGYIKN